MEFYSDDESVLAYTKSLKMMIHISILVFFPGYLSYLGYTINRARLSGLLFFLGGALLTSIPTVNFYFRPIKFENRTIIYFLIQTDEIFITTAGFTLFFGLIKMKPIEKKFKKDKISIDLSDVKSNFREKYLG